MSHNRAREGLDILWLFTRLKSFFTFLTVMNIVALKDEVARIQWHHSIDLGNGIVTPGKDNSCKKLRRLRLPDSLVGKTVLDIGTWDGFYAFEAERRGASRVLALDSFVWQPGFRTGRQGFDLAHRILDSKVESMVLDPLDLSPGTIGTFDVVLFLGVLYHMRHPLLALERMASVTKGMVIVETAVDMLWCRRPAMAFYPGDELARDPSNWCGPNPAAVVGMLKTAGFSRVEVVSGCRSSLFRFARAIHATVKHGAQFWSGTRIDRIVAHASK
jgi:tRNA (mo5U34)-methyltransferase